MSDRIVVLADSETMSQRASELIIESVRNFPTALICAATGESPTRTYELLAEQYAISPELFRNVRLIKLDEWCDLQMDDPASCEAYMQQHVIRPLKISADRYIAFESSPEDRPVECDRIALALEQHGPIDLAIVGIGINGHIGFNEPDRNFEPHAHIEELTLQTRQHAMLSKSPIESPQDTVRHGLTLGMNDLLQARQVIVLACGQHKQEPLQKMIDPGNSGLESPASYLWCHGNAICFCDQAALPT